MTEAALPSRAGRRVDWWPARPPEWLWWSVLLLQAVPALLLTSFSYFYIDDFLLLGQARLERFSAGYLRLELFGHFSPDLRAVDSLLVAVDSGSWVLARVFAMVIYLATIGGAMLVLRFILGRSWTAFSLALVFGQSLILLRALGWWSAQTAIMINSAFVLLAFGCALRWFERRGPWWLLGTLVAFFLALCDYELAMIFPIFLVLARLLVMEDDLSPRKLWRVLWSERWMWLGLLLLDVLTLVNFFASRYYVSTPSPGLGQLLEMLFDTAFYAFIPATLGYSHYPAVPGPLALLATVGPFLVVLAITLYVRPRAWRALVAFVISFALAMVPLGLNRIWAVGPTVGEELFYELSAQIALLVFVAFAVSRRWGGSRRGLRRPSWLTGGVVAGSAVLALALYGTAYVISARRLGAGVPIAGRTESYVHHYIESADAVGRRLGRRPSVVDGPVPSSTMPVSYVPFNDNAIFLGMFRPRAVFDLWRSPIYEIGDTGALRRVRPRQLARGSFVLSAIVPGPAAALQHRGGAVCVRYNVPLSVRVPLRSEGAGRAPSTAARAIGLGYRAPVRTVSSALIGFSNGSLLSAGAGKLPAGGHRWLFPIEGTAPAGAVPSFVQLTVAPRMCLTSVAEVALEPAG